MAFEKVASLHDLEPERPHRVDVGEVPVCLVRLGERVHAIHDTCSHAEFSLCEGSVFLGEIECALHGSMFSLETGQPSSLPATTPVPVFACQVDGDAVLVDVETNLNGAPLPRH